MMVILGDFPYFNMAQNSEDFSKSKTNFRRDAYKIMRIFVGDKMKEEGFRCTLIEWAQHIVGIYGRCLK